MHRTLTQLDPSALLSWSVYGLGLMICVLGSLVASRNGRRTLATSLATLVWAGAALPIAVWSSSLPGGAALVDYPLAGLAVFGIFQVRTALSGARVAVAS